MFGITTRMAGIELRSRIALALFAGCSVTVLVSCARAPITGPSSQVRVVVLDGLQPESHGEGETEIAGWWLTARDLYRDPNDGLHWGDLVATALERNIPNLQVHSRMDLRSYLAAKEDLLKKEYPDMKKDQARRLVAEQSPLDFGRSLDADFVVSSRIVDAWLTQSLIVSCIDSELGLLDFDEQASLGQYYAGVDFGKHQDASVLVVVQKVQHALKIVHVHRFPLKTQYASVIGYVKSIRDRWSTVGSVYADVTGVGDYIVEDMQKSGLSNVTGVTFSLQSKEEMATILREKMRAGEVKIPYKPADSLRDVDLTAELNVEKFELLKTGHIKFTHPEGSHDDVFWATALAVYGAAKHPGTLGLVDFGTVGDKN